jgi:general L-amino acid transport system permease protein
MSESSPAFSKGQHTPVPFWRDVRILRWLFQFVVLALVIGGLWLLIRNLLTNLEEVGLNLSFDFLKQPAGFEISEGPLFDKRDTIWQAFLIGIVNTVRIVGIGILLATILGTIVGIARLSTNWLTRRVALWYIELIQNTPLLLQLFFWYTLVLALPRQRRDEIFSLPRQPINLGPLHIPPLAYFSQRGAVLPGIEKLPAFNAWLPFVGIAILIAIVVWIARVRLRERQGLPAVGQFWMALGAFGAIVVLGAIIVPGAPFRIVIPELAGERLIVNYEGGWQLTAPFQAVLLGLVLYTAAFIAEVVRAGIQAVPGGQVEAATALSLTRPQQLRLIILPQALRVIIPPLINQYLNLAKNSSLAIAVGYPDLFNVSQTIGNSTGQNVQRIIMVMVTYLAFSILISLVMNYVNKRIQLVER